MIYDSIVVLASLAALGFGVMFLRAVVTDLRRGTTRISTRRWTRNGEFLTYARDSAPRRFWFAIFYKAAMAALCLITPWFIFYVVATRRI